MKQSLSEVFNSLFFMNEANELTSSPNSHPNIKSKYLDNFNDIIGISNYFTYKNTILHHIDGYHNHNEITNVCLIRNKNDNLGESVLGHLIIHIYAALATNTYKLDLSEVATAFLLACNTTSVQFYVFDPNFVIDDADLKVIRNKQDDKDKYYSRLITNPKNDPNYLYNKYHDALKEIPFEQYISTYTDLLKNAPSTAAFGAAITKTEDDADISPVKLPEAIKEAFGSAYSNNLDLTKALQNKDYCVELIKDFYGYDGPIETGGFYILPDGTAVKSVNHMDIDNLLIRYHYITKLDKEPMQYGDGSQFMDAINCVRIRRRGGRDSWILPYMILPENQLTPMQYSVIENWVRFVMEKSHELSVQTLDNQYKTFKASQHSYFDVIDAIKMYYRAHVLEDINIDDPASYLVEDLWT